MMVIDMAEKDTRLTQFLADLHRCKPNEGLKKKLKHDPEVALAAYDLKPWQRELLFTLDRKKIADAVYWEIVAGDPYEGDEGLHVEWAKPKRALQRVPDTIAIAADATIEIRSSGLRPSARFELVSYASDSRYRTTELPTYQGDLDNQVWSLTFDTRDATPGDYLRLRADDGSGELVSAHPLKLEPETE